MDLSLSSAVATKALLHKLKNVVKGCTVSPDELLQKMVSEEKNKEQQAEEKEQLALISKQLLEVLSQLPPRNENNTKESILDSLDCNAFLSIVQLLTLHLLYSVNTKGELSDDSKDEVLSSCSLIVDRLSRSPASTSWLVNDVQMKKGIFSLQAVFTFINDRIFSVSTSSLTLLPSQQSLLAFLSFLLSYVESLLGMVENAKKVFVALCEDLLPSLWTFLALGEPHKDKISLIGSLHEQCRSFLSSMLFQGEVVVSGLSQLVSLDAFASSTLEAIDLPSPPNPEEMRESIDKQNKKLLLGVHQSKGRNKSHYAEKLLHTLASFLQRTNIDMHAQAAVARMIVDIYVSRSKSLEDFVGGHESESVLGYRKHVSRVVSFVAALLATLLHSLSSIENAWRSDSIFQAILSTVVQAIAVSLHSLPVHAQMTKYTNFLYALYRRSLYMFSLSTVTWNQTKDNLAGSVMVFAIDSLRWLQQVDHRFVVDNRQTILTLLDAYLVYPQGDYEAFYQAASRNVDDKSEGDVYWQIYRAKRLLFNDLWKLFASLRTLDSFAKILATIGGAVNVYSFEDSQLQAEVWGFIRRYKPSTLLSLLGGGKEKLDEDVIQVFRGVPQGQWTNIYYSVTRIPQVSAKSSVIATHQLEEKVEKDHSMKSQRTVIANAIQYQLAAYVLHTHPPSRNMSPLNSKAAESKGDGYHTNMVAFVAQIAEDLCNSKCGFIRHLLVQLIDHLLLYLIQHYSASMQTLLSPFSLHVQDRTVENSISLHDLILSRLLTGMPSQDFDISVLPSLLRTVLHTIQYMNNLSAKVDVSPEEVGCDKAILRFDDFLSQIIAFTDNEANRNAVKQCMEVLLRNVHIWSSLFVKGNNRRLEESLGALVLRGLEGILQQLASNLLSGDVEVADVQTADIAMILNTVLIVDNKVLQKVASRLMDRLSSLAPSCSDQEESDEELAIIAESALYCCVAKIFPKEWLECAIDAEAVATFAGKVLSSERLISHSISVAGLLTALELLVLRFPIAQNGSSISHRLIIPKHHLLFSVLNSLFSALQSSLPRENVYQAMEDTIVHLLNHIMTSICCLARHGARVRRWVMKLYQLLYRQDLRLMTCFSGNKECTQGYSLFQKSLSRCQHSLRVILELELSRRCGTNRDKVAVDGDRFSSIVVMRVLRIAKIELHDLLEFFNSAETDQKESCTAALAQRLETLSIFYTRLSVPKEISVFLVDIAKHVLTKLSDITLCSFSLGPLALLAVSIDILATFDIEGGNEIPISTLETARSFFLLLMRHQVQVGACKAYELAEEGWILMSRALWAFWQIDPKLAMSLLRSISMATQVEGDMLNQAMLISAEISACAFLAKKCLAQGRCEEELIAVFGALFTAAGRQPQLPTSSAQATLTNISGKKRAAEQILSEEFNNDSSRKATLLVVVGGLDKLRGVSNQVQELLGERVAGQRHGRVLAAARRFSQTLLPFLLSSFQSLFDLLIECRHKSDLLMDAVLQWLLLFYDLGQCLVRGLLPHSVQLMPLFTLCLSRAVALLHQGFLNYGRVAVTKAAQLVVRVVGLLSLLTDLQSQRSALLLAMLAALSTAIQVDGAPSAPKKNRAEDSFARFSQENLAAAFFPLLDRLSVKEKERVFLQLDSSGRALLNDLQDIYNRNYKYKGY